MEFKSGVVPAAVNKKKPPYNPDMSKPEQMTFLRLGQYLHWRPDRAKPEIAMRFYEKLSRPLGCLILIFVAAPLAFVQARRMNREGLPYIAIVVIMYYVMQSSFSALGDTGRMIPIFAAWLPNCILLSLSIGMILRSTDALYVPDLKDWLLKHFGNGSYRRSRESSAKTIDANETDSGGSEPLTMLANQRRKAKEEHNDTFDTCHHKR